MPVSVCAFVSDCRDGSVPVRLRPLSRQQLRLRQEEEDQQQQERCCSVSKYLEAGAAQDLGKGYEREEVLVISTLLETPWS